MENNEENKLEITEAEEKIEETNQTDETQGQSTIENTSKGLSIASLVLGIVSILFVSRFIIAVACGVLAIIFGIKGKKRGGQGMAAAGFITGIIGLSLQAIFFVFGLMVGRALLGLFL
jgi:uncharacterized membrane protein